MRFDRRFVKGSGHRQQKLPRLDPMVVKVLVAWPRQDHHAGRACRSNERSLAERFRPVQAERPDRVLVREAGWTHSDPRNAIPLQDGARLSRVVLSFA
jgi:hypothetical protein